MLFSCRCRLSPLPGCQSPFARSYPRLYVSITYKPKFVGQRGGRGETKGTRPRLSSFFAPPPLAAPRFYVCNHEAKLKKRSPLTSAHTLLLLALAAGGRITKNRRLRPLDTTQRATENKCASRSGRHTYDQLRLCPFPHMPPHTPLPRREQCPCTNPNKNGPCRSGEHTPRVCVRAGSRCKN